MTARRDERETARNARAVALQQVAKAAAELAAIPGWLLVGDPARLDDPALRAQAEHAVGLRTRLDEIHRGVAALDAELDALDGERKENIFLFLEWSTWLESLGDAQSVLDQLSPDPRRQFLAAVPALLFVVGFSLASLLAFIVLTDASMFWLLVCYFACVVFGLIFVSAWMM